MTVKEEKVKPIEEIEEKTVSQDSKDEEPRIGVFVCHCGHNIAGTVDVEKVAEHAGKLPNVVKAEHYMFMCSKPGVQMVKDSIKELGVNRTVVASCSKNQHGRTFVRKEPRNGHQGNDEASRRGDGQRAWLVSHSQGERDVVPRRDRRGTH